ncbi:MAG TPA: aminotransferase class V-fold PLP-dependent enzyme [Phycisphaerales bacterium]|nr:aminotransferase class V-fold PLP-dependent enzyme [Phycisphaerales bacterium]
MTRESAAPLIRPAIADAAAGLGAGPLTEEAVRRHIHPLFKRVLARDEIYLANHSLGRPLDLAAEDVREAMDLWYARMDHAWPAWMDAMRRFRALQARLIGCARPDAIVPRVSAGQGVRAVLNALAQDRPRVVTTRGEFDSVDHILKTYARRGRAQVRWVDPDARGLFSARAVCDAVREGADLVVVSVVYFVTGQVLEGLDEIVRTAHEHGAMVLLDAYHGAGAIPLDFDRLGPDFAVGGNYKYTRGGPGAAWLAVHPRHLRDEGEPAIFTLDTGWFAKRAVFDFRRPESPELAPGGDAWLEATPAVLTSYQALAGLELTTSIGVERLRPYNLEQQAFLEDELASRGVPVLDIEPHGAFLLIPTDDFQGLCARVLEEGVNVDARPALAPPKMPGAAAPPAPARGAAGRPGYVRVCPDLLNTRAELAEAALRIARAFERS